MNEIMEYLPLLIPVVIVQVVLAVVALIHVLRHKAYRFGNRMIWILVVLFVQIIGPVVYFAVGKEN